MKKVDLGRVPGSIPMRAALSLCQRLQTKQSFVGPANLWFAWSRKVRLVNCWLRILSASEKKAKKDNGG